jgi:hypothetical protein
MACWTAFKVAGLDSNGPKGGGAHVHWVDRPVSPGDRVEIRIFEGEFTDPPTATERFSEADVCRATEEPLAVEGLPSQADGVRCCHRPAKARHPQGRATEGQGPRSGQAAATSGPRVAAKPSAGGRARPSRCRVTHLRGH